MEEKKTITIKKTIWKKLNQLKTDKELTFDTLFEYFLKKEKK